MSNDSSPYYGPVGETAEEVFLEKTFLASGYLTAFGFGVQFILYAACVHKLWQRQPRIRFTFFLIAYMTVLTLMDLIWTATSAYGLQMTFIDNRNYPGGPFAFLLVEFSEPSNVLSLASYIVANILADGLLLWRCKVIWTASETYSVLVPILLMIPTLALMASFAIAVVFAIETASPSGFFSQTTISFAVPYFAISLGLNIFLTLLIAVRMSYYRRHGRSVFGSQYGKHYTSISTMFIESAALYCICAILLLGTYIVQHPINQIWLGLAPSLQIIANNMIIYRVAEGRAWSSDVFTKSDFEVSNTSMAFDTRGHRSNTTSSRGRDINNTTSHLHTPIDVPLQDFQDYDIPNKDRHTKFDSDNTVKIHVTTDVESGTFVQSNKSRPESLHWS